MIIMACNLATDISCSIVGRVTVFVPVAAFNNSRDRHINGNAQFMQHLEVLQGPSAIRCDGDQVEQ